MWELKVYEELVYIECYDWEIRTIATDIATVNNLLKEEQFLNLWNELINKTNIKRVYKKELSDVDKVIYSIEDKNIRAKLQAEVDRRIKEWLRVNVEIVKNLYDKITQ